MKHSHASLAADDIATLRQQAGVLLCFIASSLQSESDHQADYPAGPETTDLSLFFIENADYIQLRLECSFTLKDIVQEINLLRSACQDCIFKFRQFIDNDAARLITLNKIMDVVTNSAMEEYSTELKVSKQRFLSTINHDTRSPLFAIALGVRRLLKDVGVSKEIARVTQLISKSAELALSRISDYHDFCSIELGQRMVLYPTSVDMSELCREIIDELKLLFPDLAIVDSISSNIDGTWDRSRIRQAIYIALLNAIQAGETGNQIELRVGSVDDLINIDIVNTQGKINSTVKRVIFDPIMLGSVQRDHKIHFKEAEQNRMGLYLAREIILSHFGTLTIDQTKEEGLRFRIAIPRHLVNFSPPVFSSQRSVDAIGKSGC